MKIAKLLVLLAVGLFLSGCVNPRDWRDGGGRDGWGGRNSLEGTWYSGGDRNKVASIVSTRDGWEARNEHGQTTRLVPDGRDFVRALDWEGGLRAEIRNDRINWANNSFWTRRPN